MAKKLAKLKFIEDKNKKKELKAKKHKAIIEKRASALKLLIPVIIGGAAIVALVLLGLNRYLFRYNIDEEGYAIPKDLVIGSINVDAKEKKPLHKFGIGESVYTLKDSTNDYYLGDSRVSVNSNYPVYIRNGQVLYFLNNNLNLVSNDFDNVSSYAGLRLSEGITFNNDDSRADLDEMILVEVDSGYQLAQNSTIGNEYSKKSIPTNTICNFSEDRIDCYEFDEGILKSYAVSANENDIITIGDNEYSYKELLQNLGLWKEKTIKINAEEEAEEPERVKRTKPKDYRPADQTPSTVFEQPKESTQTTRAPQQGGKKPAPVRPEYVEPVVSADLDNLDAWVYSITIPMSVYDPTKKIMDGGAQLYVYERPVERDASGNIVYNAEGEPNFLPVPSAQEPYLRVVASSRMTEDYVDIVLSQLQPDSYYFIKYSYRYYDKYNYPTVVGNDLGVFKTLGYDELEQVSLDLDSSDVEIYDRKFEISHLFYSRMNGSNYAVFNGREVPIGSPEVNLFRGYETKCAENYITSIIVQYREGEILTEEGFETGAVSLKFNTAELNLMKKGFKMSVWSTPETLKPGTDYTYRIILEDKFGHKFNYEGTGKGLHYTKTCKLNPSVTIAVPARGNTPISVGVEVKWINTDDCEVKDGGPKLYLTEEGKDLTRANGVRLIGYYLNEDGTDGDPFDCTDGVPIKHTTSGEVTKLRITNLPTQTSFTAYVVSSFDDNALVGDYRRDIVLRDSFVFRSGSLTSYGLVRYRGTVDGISNNAATIHPRLNYNNNQGIFDYELLKHINKIIIDVAKQSDLNHPIQSITLNKESVNTIAIDATGATEDANGNIYLPVDGTAYSVPAKVIINGEEKDTNIKMTLHYKGSLPKYVGVDQQLGNDAATVWEYILATSNSLSDAYFDIELDQTITYDDGQPAILTTLEKFTAYRVALTFKGRIEGSDSSLEEDVTSTSSTPLLFNTKKVEPTVKWGELFISDDFVEFYDIKFNDPDSCILEDKTGTGYNARIVIKEKAPVGEEGMVVQIAYIDSRSQNPSPLRVSGLVKDQDYTIEIVVNEYDNIEYQTSYALQLENTDIDATTGEFARMYEFTAHGDLSGNIELDSLYRTYTKGPIVDVTNPSSEYIGVIKNELLPVAEEGDRDRQVDIYSSSFDLTLDPADTIDNTGWKYNPTSDTYTSTLTKIENNASYSLFTSAKTSTDTYLPEYLKQIDYLETSGLQYVKTGYYHNENTEVSIEFQPLNNNASSTANDIFGSRTSTSGNDCFSFGFGFVSPDNGFYSNVGPFGRVASDGSPSHYLAINDLFVYHTFDISSGGINYDNKGIYPLFTEAQVLEQDGKIGTATLEDYLFAVNEANVANYKASVRLKSFRISELGLTIMDLVPVITTSDVSAGFVNTGKKVPAGTICLYDKISRKIFVNSGTGEFGYASNANEVPLLDNDYNGKLKQVSYIEPIENSGTFIDSGYKHKDSTVIEAIFMPVRYDGTWNGLFGSRRGTIKADTWDVGYNNTTNYFFVNTSAANMDNIMYSREYEDYSSLKLTNTSLTINGRSVATGVQVIGDAYFNDYIFNINENGTAIHPGLFKLKYFKISENANAVREYIPVVVKENIVPADGLKVSKNGGVQTNASVTAGTAGLYDLVQDVLYLNSTTANFKYPGSDPSVDPSLEETLEFYNLRPVKYITATGSQYIDTGLTSKYGYDTNISFSINNTSVGCGHIIGSHGDSGTSQQSNDSGTKSWHHSYLRTNSGKLVSSYQGAEKYNVLLVPSVVYDVEMAIYDAYSAWTSTTNKTLNPLLNGDIRNAGYLKVNGEEVWNAVDQTGLNLERKWSASTVTNKIGLFAGIYANNNPFNYSQASIYSCVLHVPDASDPWNTSKLVTLNLVPCIATDDIDADMVSYKGSTGTTSAVKGTIGLFDTVHNIFYINSGTGTFKYGDYNNGAGDVTSSSNESGTYTISLYGVKDNALVELDHIKSDLAANGNIFNVKDYHLEEGSPVYVQVKVENPPADFRIGDIYLEKFDDRYNVDNKVNLIQSFNEENAPILTNYSYDQNGNRVDTDGYAVSTEFTSVRPDSVYYLSGTNLYENNGYNYQTRDESLRTLASLGDETLSSSLLVNFYNSNKEFISSQYVGSQGALFKTPAGAAFVRFTLRGDVNEPTGSPSTPIIDEENTIVVDLNESYGIDSTQHKFVDGVISGTEDGFNYNYRPVEYIQSDGTHWIDTNYKPNKNTKWEFEYQFINSSTGRLGTGTNDSAYTPNAPMLMMWLNGGNANFAIGKNSITTNIPVGNFKHIYEVNAHTQKGIIDGNKEVVFTDAQVYGDPADPNIFEGENATATITFFAKENRMNFYQYAHAAKLYWSKIWEYDEITGDYKLLHNYIPVVRTKVENNLDVKDTEVYGLYDTCEGKFLMSRTENTFTTPTDTTTGNTIVKTDKKFYEVIDPNLADTESNRIYYDELDYIESNGGQAIDTEFVPTSTSTVNMVFEPAHFDATATPQALAGAYWGDNSMLFDIQSGLFQHHGLAMNSDYIIGYNNNLTESQYVMPLANRKYNITYGSKDNGFEMDINYVDTDSTSDSYNKTREFGLDWRFEMYGSDSNNTPRTPMTLKAANPSSVRYLNDRRLGSNFAFSDYYNGLATTWLYVEDNISLAFDFYTDDAGQLYARYADGTVLNGVNSSTNATPDNPYGAGVYIGSCATKKITLNLKKGWNEVVVSYHENGGGDYFNVTPRFNTIPQITKRSAEYPKVHEINKDLVEVGIGVAAGDGKIIPRVSAVSDSIKVSSDAMTNAQRGNLFLLGINMPGLNLSTFDDGHPSKYYSYGKLYSAIVNIDSTHRIVLTPAKREKDGEVGLWGQYQKRDASEANKPSWDGTWTNDNSDEKGTKFFPRANTQTKLTGGRTILPTEYYSKLNYIEALGNQYIYTGVWPTADINIKLSFAPTLSTGTAAIVGTYTWDSNSFLLDYQSSKYYIHGPSNVIGTQAANVKHEFEFSTTSVKVDGLEKANTDTLAKAGGRAIYLLGFNVSSYNALGKLYYTKIENKTTGEVLRDFIPVRRDIDGAIGLWDQEHDKFYANNGSNDFASGSALGDDDIDLDIEKHISSNAVKFTRNAQEVFDGGLVFQPEASGEYRFTSKNIVSGDPFIYVFGTNEDGELPKYYNVFSNNKIKDIHNGYIGGTEEKGYADGWPVFYDDDTGGAHNFKLDATLDAAKKYYIVCSNSNFALKGEFEYDLLVTGSVSSFDFTNAQLYLYDASNLDDFTATFTASVTQTINKDFDGDGTTDPGLLDNGEISIRLYQTRNKVTSSTNLDDYTDWVDYRGPETAGLEGNCIYHLPKDENPISGIKNAEETQETFDMPIPGDKLAPEIDSEYGYKAALYVKREGKDAEILLDYVTFVATQPIYVIKDIQTLKAVSADMAGYYICVHDIPNKDVDGDGNPIADGDRLVDFTVSDEMFTGVIDWQGHSVTLSSEKPLFNKLGQDALIKNGNIIYEGTGNSQSEVVPAVFPESADGQAAKAYFNSNFKQVEYIQATGDQVIVTDIKQSQNTYYEVEFERTDKSTAEQVIVGNYGADNNMMLIRLENDGNTAHAALTNARRYYIRNLDLNKRVKYTLGATTFTVNDGVERSVDIVRDNYSNGSLVTILAQGTANGGSFKSLGKLYSVKIYQGTDLVFDGIPCVTMKELVGDDVKTNVQGTKGQAVLAGTAGLYNMVDGYFYTSIYQLGYPALKYDDDLTEGLNWVNNMINCNAEQVDTLALSNEVPKIPGYGYWDGWASYALNSRTPYESALITIKNADGTTYSLPDKYQRLEYLQSDGNAYINTGIYFKSTDSVNDGLYVKFEFLEVPSGQAFVMGCAGPSSAYGYRATNVKVNGRLQAYYLGNMVNDTYNVKGLHEVWINNNKKNRYWRFANYADNWMSWHHTNSGRYPNYDRPITLFAESGGGYNRVRIYACYLQQAGTIVRNMVPAMALEDIPASETSTGKMVPAGTLGMFDTYSKKFFVNVSPRGDSQFYGPSNVASVKYESAESNLQSQTACIAKDNYGTLSNMIVHFHPEYDGVYDMANDSAGFVYNNYGTIDKFALQFDDGDIYVDNTVAGVTVNNYGTISNGYVCGKEYLDEDGNKDYYGFVHRYDSISGISAVAYRDESDPDTVKYKYIYERSDYKSDAGNISYVASHNENKATIKNVYVVDNLKIQSTDADSGAYGNWGDSSAYITDNIASVEYLESDGKQFIDTGYTPNKNTEIEFTWSPTAHNGSQAIIGTTWAANSMGLWADNTFYHAGLNKKTNAPQQIGEKYDVFYNIYADQLTVNGKSAFDWKFEIYPAIGSGWLNIQRDFDNQSPTSTIRYYNDTDLSLSMAIGDNYGGKGSTWLYTESAFDLNVRFGTDDQGYVRFNGQDIITQNASCAYNNATLHFVPGWNELNVYYREGSGGDGFYVRLADDTSKTLNDVPQITKRCCYDPEEDIDQIHKDAINPDTGDSIYISDKLTNATTTLKLFGLNGSNYAYGRMYGCKIYEKNEDGTRTLIHDFYPGITSYDLDATRSATGFGILKDTPGFYDAVPAKDETGEIKYDNLGKEIHLFYPSNSATDLITSYSYDDSANNTDFSALICGNNEGTISDVFSAGDILDVEYDAVTHPDGTTTYATVDSAAMVRIGPAVGACVDSFDNSNINYVSIKGEQYINDTSASTYMHKNNTRSEAASLYDYAWYESMLHKDGEVFELRSSVDANNFPRLIFNQNIDASLIPSTRLPSAQIPIKIVGSETRYIGKSDTGYQTALVTVLLTNPDRINITALKVVDENNTELITEVVDQGASVDNYRVDLLITYDDQADVAPMAQSTYRITSYGTGGETSRVWHNFANRLEIDEDIESGNRNENVIDVSFYHEIKDEDDWTDYFGGINHSTIQENFRLVNDISFLRSANCLDWIVFADFTGNLDGGIYSTERVVMDNYKGEPLEYTINIENELTGMHTVSDIGNVDRNGEYLSSRGMGSLDPSRYPYTNINSVRSCLFASVSGSLNNIVFSNFRTVYFNDVDRTDRANSINDVTNAIAGVIARANSGSILDNLHVRNSEFNTRGYGGSLVGNASNAVIRNCSARNTTVTGRTLPQVLTSSYIGGLVGYGYNTKFDNCFVADINVNSNNSDYIVGTGGIAGVVDSSDFYSCYAVNGVVTSGGDCAGGIVGKVGEFANTTRNDYSYSTTVEGCYSTVTVQSTGDFVGGIAGYMGIYNGTADRADGNKLFNSYTASTVISTNYSSTNINRINSHFNEDKRYYFNNYAFENQVMNYKNNDATSITDTYQFGPTEELNGSTRLLAPADLSVSSTWSGEIMLDENCYDFDNNVPNGYMPKLLNTTTGGVLYDQPDELLGNELVASLKIVNVTNNSRNENLEVDFILYNEGWDRSTFTSYGSKQASAWYDLADWSQFSCVGAATYQDADNRGNCFVKGTATADGGLSFHAVFNYGDPVVGHYSDAYLITLPVYLTDPDTYPRITSSVYALIALDEDNVAVKNIHNAQEWNEFFAITGSHYNTPENIRLFTDGEYFFEEHPGDRYPTAFNAAIQKAYISYDQDQDPSNTKVVFKGNINYDISEWSSTVDDISFISRTTEHFCGIEFNNFNVNYNDYVCEAPQGIIGDVSGEFNNNNFIDCKVMGANANFTGLIGRVQPGAMIEDINIENTLVDSEYKNMTTGGFGGFIGSVAGTSSKQVTINNVTASAVSVSSHDGANTNVGGLYGNVDNANISNTEIVGKENTSADLRSLPAYLDQLDYVESNHPGGRLGNQGAAVDTGVSVDNTTKVELDFVPTAWTGDTVGIAGCRNGNNKFAMWFASNMQVYLTYRNVTDRYVANGKTLTYGRRYNVVMDAASGLKMSDYYTGDIVAEENAALTGYNDANNGIILFGVNNATNDRQAAAQKIYGAKIYKGGDIVRDYVPVVVNTDTTMKVSRYNNNKKYSEENNNKTIVVENYPVSKGTAGLYDTVNGVLYAPCNSDYNAAYYDAPLLAGQKIDETYGIVAGDAMVGGMIGKVANSTITNVSISNVDVVGKGNIVGGVVASGSNTKLINVYKVNNMHVTDYNTNVGGIVGVADSAQTAYNIDLYDMFATSSSTDAGSSSSSEDGSTVGSSPNNAQLTNINISAQSYCGGILGQLVNQSIKADNLTVDGINIIAVKNCVGGLIGNVQTLPFIMEFKDGSFKNINIQNGNASDGVYGSYWGGIIGDEYRSGGMKFTNCVMDNIYVRADDRAGGVIGRTCEDDRTGSLTIDHGTISNITVLGVKKNFGNGTNGFIGGVVGLCYDDVYLDNQTTMDGITIVGGKYVGGVVGGNWYGQNRLYYYGSHDPDPIITYETDEDGEEIAIETPGDTTNNVRINNVDITTYGWLAGGFMGGDGQNTQPYHNVVQNVFIDNVKVTSMSRDALTGGLAGNAAYIKNCYVGSLEEFDPDTIAHDASYRGASDNPSIYITGSSAHYAGLAVGGLGCPQSQTKYVTSNVHVIDGQINLTGTTKDDDEKNIIGGLAGAIYKTEVRDCTVNNSTIEGYSRVGGVAGIVPDRYDCDLHDLKVNNSIIVGIYDPQPTTPTSRRSNYVGGIVGINEGVPSKMYNLEVNNSVIIGDNYVGGITGYMYSRPDDASTPPAVHDSGIVDTTVIGIGDYVGGVVGAFRASNGRLYNCYVTHGELSGSDPHILDSINKLHYTEDTIKNNLKSIYNNLSDYLQASNGDYIFSSYILSKPTQKGTNNTDNTLGGIVGLFKGSDIHDVYVDASTLISSYQEVEGTYTTTGGVVGYMYDNASSAEIVDGYDILEYIKSNKVGSINTGVTVTDAITMRVKFEVDEYNGYELLGYYDTGRKESDSFRFILGSGATTLDYGSGSGGNRIQGGGIALNTIQEYEIGNRYAKNLLTGHLLLSNNKVSFGNKGYTIYVNGYKQSSNPIQSSKIYYLQIFDRDKLVRDYIPARRRSDSVVGLYDKVTKEFHTSTTGAFEASPNVVGTIMEDAYDVVPYLQSDGKEWINTNHYPTTDTKVVIDIDIDDGELTTDYKGIVGAGKEYNTTDGLILGLHKASNRFVYYTGGANNIYLDGANPRNRHVITLTVPQLSSVDQTNGASYSVSSGKTALGSSDNRSINIFRVNTNNTALINPVSAKLYSAQIYEGDVLISDYVPVRRRSDGELGLYDKVKHIFVGDCNTEVNTDFTTDTSALQDATSKVAKPVLLSNSIVNGTVLSLAKEGVTVDPNKEATGGFVGFYDVDMQGYVPDIINDYYSFPVGRDYNLTQGPDPLSYSNLMFGGNVIGQANADVGFGVTKVTRASEYLYKEVGAGTYASDWTLAEQITGASSTKYIHYNTAMTEAGYTAPAYLDTLVKGETVYRTGASNTLQYAATKDNLTKAHDISNDNTDIGMREAGIGRLRITPSASITIGTTTSAVKDKYNITNNYSGTLTVDDTTNYIEALVVNTPGSSFYYGPANKGNMALNDAFWSRFLGGSAPVSVPRMFGAVHTPKADIETLLENAIVYPSGIDTINIELKDAPTVNFNYSVRSTDSTVSGTWNARDKVITLKYDYSSDITIQFHNETTSANRTVEYEDFSRTIMTYNNTYCYIYNGQVVNENGNSTIGETEYIHMYDGKLLDEFGNIYDAASGTKIGSVSGLANTDTKSLWSGIINSDGSSYPVNTFARFSMSGNVEVGGRIYVKNNTLITLSTLDTIIDGPIADTYGQNIYATVLLDDGMLVNLGTSLNYPEEFKNNNIKEITSTINYSGRIALVRYKDNTLVAFNYITGEEIPIQSDTPSLVQSFANFFAESLRNFSLRDNTSKAENTLNDATIYQNNINNNPAYANALDNVNENIERDRQDVDTKTSDIVDIPDEMIGESEYVEPTDEKVNGDIAIPSEEEITEEKEEIRSDVGEVKEYSIDNSYVVLYNDKEDKTELFKVSEVLSKPTEERVSEEEKAKTLESLGIKTLVPAREETQQNTVSGGVLVASIIIALFSLIGILFIIRKKHFSYEK